MENQNRPNNIAGQFQFDPWGVGAYALALLMGNLLRNYRTHWSNASAPTRIYLFGAVLMGFSQAVTFSLLARYLDAIGLDKIEVGKVLACNALGRTLIALPAAFWLARRPVRGTFVCSALIGGGSYLVLPWFESLYGLMALNLLAGMSLAVHYVMIAPFLFRHTRAEERASIFGLAEAIRTMASVLGALAAGTMISVLMSHWLESGASEQIVVLAEADATGYAIMGAGLTTILAAFLYARIVDVRNEEASSASVSSDTWKYRGIIARFALPQLFVASGSGLCISFLPLYFKDRFGMGPESWGYLFASGQVLMTIGLLLSPWILVKLGYVRSIVAIELASLPFFLLLALTTSLPLAVVAYLLRGAFMNSTHPIHKNLMMLGTPSGVREVQTGINATLWGLGWVIGPQVGGIVLKRTGDDYSLLMYATMGCYVVAAFLTFFLLRPIESRVRQLSQD